MDRGTGDRPVPTAFAIAPSLSPGRTIPATWAAFPRRRWPGAWASPPGAFPRFTAEARLRFGLNNAFHRHVWRRLLARAQRTQPRPNSAQSANSIGSRDLTIQRGILTHTQGQSGDTFCEGNRMKMF